MKRPRVAMVFTHPAGHELSVYGLIARFRPRILFVTRGDSDGSTNHEQLACQGLAAFELADNATFLSRSERESYERAFAGDVAYYASWQQAIYQWLEQVKPDVVFGDAFELYNFNHDMVRVVLDGAIRRYSAAGRTVRNYELALACRTEPELDKIRYQEFPYGHSHVFSLDTVTDAKKTEVIRRIGLEHPEIAQLLSICPTHRESYRRVRANRDYSVPPAGLRRHYDEWGQEQVRRGKYAHALLFDEHFVPIVRGLGLMQYRIDGPEQQSVKQTHRRFKNSVNS